MARCKRLKGGDDLLAKLQALEAGTERVAEASLKGGAAVLADAVRENIGKLPEDTGVTKRGLQESLGFTPVGQGSGLYDIKVGFDGYNEDGMANVFMARIMESGTSTTKKHPFFRPAVNKAKDQALCAMEQAADKEIEKITKG